MVFDIFRVLLEEVGLLALPKIDDGGVGPLVEAAERTKKFTTDHYVADACQCYSRANVADIGQYSSSSGDQSDAC